MALPNISLGVIDFICDVARYGNRGKPVEIDRDQYCRVGESLAFPLLSIYQTSAHYGNNKNGRG